jgi:N-acetylmuramoyl-L-alanine amidase
MTTDIRLNDSGDHIRVYQRHLNRRLKARGEQTLVADGDCGPITIERSALAAWFLGALGETIKTVRAGTIPTRVQDLVIHPENRNEAQLERARKRRELPLPPSLGGPNGKFEIVLAGDWGAVAPTATISRVGRPDKIIFHHTDGHAPGSSLADAKAYARSIQRDHMHRTPAFIDSGHNFLVTRAGQILEGRRGSLAAIRDGVMVSSAHCPGENHNPGIEHEHKGTEAMTDAQREASLFLHELICRKTGIKPTEVHGHKEFFATACPGALEPELARFRKELNRRLAA